MSVRVLHVLDHSIPLHSGYSFRTRAILEQQRAMGWETFQLTGPKQGPTEGADEEVDGLRFHRTPGATTRLPIVGHVAVIGAIERRLQEVVEAVRPDIIHAHSPALNGLAASRVARRVGLPMVYEVRAFWEDAAVDHGTTREGSLRYRLTRGLETHVLRRANAVTCICEGLRRDIQARGIPAQRITVIPNAVDASRFTFRPPRDDALAAELGLSGGKVLGFIGSFYAYEGLDLALDALPEILRGDPGVKLLLVGGGPQADNLRAQARRLGIQRSVIFAGRVPHDAVGRYYSLVDAFVYPRHPIRLTELVTPLKPLEAMALGKPVIASDIGGHRELIRHGENGVLFPADDVHGLVHAVGELLRSGERFEGIVNRGRAFVERERTWASAVAGYHRAYGLCLGPAGDGLWTTAAGDRAPRRGE